MAMVAGNIKFLHNISSFPLLCNSSRAPSTLHFPSQPASSRLSLLQTLSVSRLPSSPLFFCTASATYAQDVADAYHSPAAQPWPEWERFLQKLRGKGYFDPAPSSEAAATGEDDSGGRPGSSLDSHYNIVRTACLRFARERPDILRSLSRENIKAVVECGCPDLFRKTVNTAKRLRAYLNINETDVCSSCNVRDTCGRAYTKATLDEVSTVDIVRLLLQYAEAESSVKNREEGPRITESVEASARKLLSELIELTDTNPHPDILKALRQPPKEDKTPRVAKLKEANKFQNVEMKRGDWICTQCNFMNYARNLRCLRCTADGPMRVDFDRPEMKKGPKRVDYDSPEMKEKGWTCPQCQYMNFAENKTCRRCQEPHPKQQLNRGNWERSSAPEMKKGDWTCPQCQLINFTKNKTCHRCQEPRPKQQLNRGDWERPSSPELKRGDWTCPQCQFMNFAKNKTCHRCQKPRPEQQLNRGDWERPLSPEMKRGDWTCPQCQFMNFAKNKICHRCQEPRPMQQLNQGDREHPKQQLNRGDRERPSSPEMKRGDWTCPQCQFMNFAKNKTCYRCEEPRPKQQLNRGDWESLSSREMKRGDWTCPQCQFMNFAKKIKCLRCKKPRPKQELNEGDWECPWCFFANFGRNKSCRKCDSDRPKVEESNLLVDDLWKTHVSAT